jgi:hypothetical protein
MLKGKLLIISVATILVALALAPLVSASPIIDGYTDKPQYKPGETVTLKFWIYNPDAQGIFLKNVTITYPWYNLLWDGNQTIKYTTTVGLLEGQNRSETVTFTIPTDGRAEGGDIVIIVTYESSGSIIQAFGDVPLNVASVPYYSAFENMDRLLMLITVLVVLVILGAIIIAATIYLTMRKPEVAWKAEQKSE